MIKEKKQKREEKVNKKKYISRIYMLNKEVILYLFFGGTTFLISIITFMVFNTICNIDELIANIFSWIIAVTYAFITNKIWVFESKATGKAKLLSELLSFFAGRLITLGLEELILFLGVKTMKINSLLVKIVAQILVIIANYLISKYWVFKKEQNSDV